MRKIIIFGLAAILILMIANCFVECKETVWEMKEENLTVVEAPEQIESIDHPDFIVEDYVVQIPEGTNVALEADIETDSFTPGYTAVKAIDGDTEGASYWEGGADTYPNNLTLDLKEEKSIHAIRLCLCPQMVWGKRTQTFAVYVGSDLENFTELIPELAYEFDPEKGNEVVIEFDAVAAQFVRLVFTDNTGAHGGQAAEVEVYAD